MPKRAEIARLRKEIADARLALAKAEAEQRAAEGRSPLITSLSMGLVHRHEHNHFGRDFEISLTPRRRRHA